MNGWKKLIAPMQPQYSQAIPAWAVDQRAMYAPNTPPSSWTDHKVEKIIAFLTERHLGKGT